MRSFLVLIFIFVATELFAVAPQFWKVANPEDFLAGEVEGLAINSRGEIRSGPSVTRIAKFSDPFVLAQATDPAGVTFLGTGNEGKVYRLEGEKLTVLYKAPEPEIYALAYLDGALYAGTSPSGKIYKIDPANGTAIPFFDPKQAYIWAIIPVDGGLAVATGIEGKLFKVDMSGQGRVLFDAPETHLRSLAARGGRLLAGGSGEGRIYEVSGSGSGRAIYDSALPEISTIYLDAAGTGWAAGVTNILPSAPPAKSDAAAKAASGGEKKEEGSGATVDVSFSFEDAASAVAAASGSGELYRIDKDGYVEVVRRFERELVYSITESGPGAIYLSTGPLGRIYEFQGNEIALIATVPEKQVVSFSPAGSARLITTTNSGAVYRFDPTSSVKGEFRSAVKDLDRFSRFGSYRIAGKDLRESAVAIAFRSGNTNTPDDTWSAWGESSGTVEGNVTASPARYLQWKLTAAKPSRELAVDSVTVAYMSRNATPVIENISVADPAVVFITGNYPAAPQIVEATNPDEYGIFSSLDAPRDRNEPGKKFFRRGFRTITWKAHDDNGDSLRYSVSFRKKGDTPWLRLRENIDDLHLNFDTSQLPDGDYEIKLVATDAHDNPEKPLTDTKEGVELTIDNSAPMISFDSSGSEVVIRVSDALSPVSKIEYSVDAQKWIRLLPLDGIADSRNEELRVRRSEVSDRFLVVRAVDNYFNVASASTRVGK